MFDWREGLMCFGLVAVLGGVVFSFVRDVGAGQLRNGLVGKADGTAVHRLVDPMTGAVCYVVPWSRWRDQATPAISCVRP